MNIWIYNLNHIFQKTNKYFHNIFKTCNNNFKSIYYLLIYHIRNKGIIVEYVFNLFFNIFIFNVIINNFKLEISNHKYGIKIKIN